MLLCYHKEYFALGLVGALFIFAIIILFEDVIREWFRKVRGIFKIA